MNEDDFVYYKDENDKVYSGGFSVNSLALKGGLSPFTPLSSFNRLSEGMDNLDTKSLNGGGGENDTEFSQQFKNHIVPSFLHYQLAGDNDNYSEKMADLLNTYHEEEQKGGDLFDQLNEFEHFLGLSVMNKKNKKFTRKGRNLINKKNTSTKNTKKNRK